MPKTPTQKNVAGNDDVQIGSIIETEATDSIAPVNDKTSASESLEKMSLSSENVLKSRH